MKTVKIAGVPEHFNLPWHLCIENGEFEFRTIHENGLHPITLALCVAPKRQLSRISQIMMNQIIEHMEALKLRMIEIIQ